MSDDEIEAEHKHIIDHFTGITTALTQVIHALQAQSGYDHKRFEAHLSIYQVSGEQKEMSGRPVFDKAYQDTLASFAKSPVQVPPLLQRLGIERGPGQGDP